MAARDFRTRLLRRAARAGLSLSDALVGQLDAFYRLLTRWNSKINLTSLSDPDEAIDRLLLEPLAAARHIPPSARTLIDVGSGGGSPAIPMRLSAPQLQLRMVEAKARKSAFLREAVRHLGLDGTIVETARVEELLTRTDLHEASDLLTLRAVRVEPRLLHTLQAFLRPGGQMLMFRSAAGPAEPTTVVPPLEFRATHPLLDSTRSRLTILGKREVGFVAGAGLSPSAPSV